MNVFSRPVSLNVSSEPLSFSGTEVGPKLISFGGSSDGEIVAVALFGVIGVVR